MKSLEVNYKVDTKHIKKKKKLTCMFGKVMQRLLKTNLEKVVKKTK
jgi:hypothetical protein